MNIYFEFCKKYEVRSSINVYANLNNIINIVTITLIH